MQMPNKSVAVRKLKGVAVSEAVEIVLVAGVLLGFTIFLMSYATAGGGPTMYSKEQQAPQINLAQQALDRVVLLNSPIAVRSGQSWRIVDLALAAPGPLYQPQLDDSKLAQLFSAAGGQLCTIQQKAFADATGISQAALAGYGLLKPAAGSLNFDYVSILKNFFGRDWDKYDITLIIKPLVNLTICPNLQVSNVVMQRRDPMCAGVQQGVWVRSTAGGRVVATAVYCTTDAGCDLSSRELTLAYNSGVGLWEARLEVPSSYLQGLGTVASLVVFAERVTYPRAMDFYVFNTTSRSLAYGMYGYDGRVWFMHDATVSCGSGNIPALGIRRLDIYTGGGFVTLAQDVTLDPGIGAGAVKVDMCQNCVSNARCAACWVQPPAGALFAVAWIERNSQGGNAPGSTIVVVPLSPTPPNAVIRVDTWLRWTPVEPQLQTAVATRIVDSRSTTYSIQLVLYKKP